MNLPFRWNIAKREQLGRLIEGDSNLPPPTFIDAILVCLARVLAFSDNADLVFVGRSPESLFDYLSGLLAPPRQHCGETLFDAPLLTRFAHILDQTRYRQQIQGTLTHSDANLHNILIDAHANSFRALIDPGPMIIGLPMYDIAYAVQPWNYGRAYHEAVVAAYQVAGGHFDALLFYTSLLCVAYQQSRYYDQTMARIRPFVQSDILPHLA